MAKQKIKSQFVKAITVIDPDTGGEVEVEIRKLESGGMVGIDGSWLDQDVGKVWSPYDKGVEIDIPDDETPVTGRGPAPEPGKKKAEKIVAVPARYAETMETWLKDNSVVYTREDMDDDIVEFQVPANVATSAVGEFGKHKWPIKTKPVKEG